MKVFSFVSPDVIFGPGTSSQCGESAVRLGARRLFVVTDPGLVKSGWLEHILRYIDKADLEHIVWDGVSTNPRDIDVLEGFKYYQQGKCDALLAIGGGSPIDTAKAIALLSSNGGNVSDYEEIDSITKPLPPMLAIPTTAGSGSEVSQFAIIVNSSERRKMTLVSKSLIPNIAIFDPRLLKTLDDRFMISSGFNVLSHAIEAFVSVASTPITDLYALDAIRISTNLLRKINYGIRDDEIYNCMSLASLQAGLAFSNAILGAVHAITHQICTRYDIPAGFVDAVLLPKVMEFNIWEAGRKSDLIAEAMGEPGDYFNYEPNKAIFAVEDLVKDLGLPRRLSELGISRDLIHQLAVNVIKDVCLMTNPRELTYNDIVAILENAY